MMRSSMIAAELGRCLRRLVPLFPDPGFQAPEVVIAPGWRPLPEIPLEPPWGVITLYSCDLVGSGEEVLTILLHKAIHAYHAFLWQSDCSCWSYHTRLFRRQAEQLGLRVGRHHPRYGWSQTLPTPELVRLFEDLAPALDLPRSARSLSRRVWRFIVAGALRWCAWVVVGYGIWAFTRGSSSRLRVAPVD